MQDQIKRIVDMNEKSTSSFESFAKREGLSGFAIKDVMALVKDCGAMVGTNEHYIAFELFVKREQREMFMTLDTRQERLEWLSRKYVGKYGH